jgi:two-component system OmpR family sensor kinase
MREHRSWLLVALAAVAAPAAVGVAAATALSRELDEMPRVYLRAELATLTWMSGTLLSLLLVGVLTLYIYVQRRETSRSAEIQAQTQAQASEERRRFLRRLDHELKNPLTAIRAGLANLKDAPSEVAQRDALTSVETQVLRISRLVADLRKLAELEIRPLERTPVDVTALLQEAVAVAQDRPEAATRRIALTVPQAPWPLPHVPGDWDLLFLAVYNLLDNALKFTQAGDRVEVRAFENGSTVAVEVAETGPGILEEDLPHVWEELYRGRSARGVPGSGLGLALVRAIVERHGGRALLRSRAGQGTVFTLILPVR